MELLRPAFEQFLADKEFSTTSTTAQQLQHIQGERRAINKKEILPR